MKVLITGGDGQLGRALFEKTKSTHEAIRLSKEHLDITNEQTIKQLFKIMKPECVFHTAAYTNVDQCETEQARAFIVNSIGALTIAKACQSIGSTMIYISSDYIFDGKKITSYIETDNPNPKNIYGLSKWLGEELVKKTLPESYIVRTSWLYGHGGQNFVNTMVRFARSQKKVKVVSDQNGAPTYVNDLVDVLLQIIEKPFGIYHVSNDGQCSWYQFAKAIYEYVGTDPNLVQPITTMEYGARANRPAFSLLNTNKLLLNDIPQPRNWKTALEEYLGKEQLND